MSTYIIAGYDVTDGDSYQDYVTKVGPIVARHGGELLVADPEARGVEGEPPSVAVVLRFESEEAALGWYNDPDYKPVRQIRFDATDNGRLVLAKGVN